MVTGYRAGLKHGKEGKQAYCHRKNNRPYDSASNRASYTAGYLDGRKLAAQQK